MIRVRSRSRSGQLFLVEQGQNPPHRVHAEAIDLDGERRSRLGQPAVDHAAGRRRGARVRPGRGLLTRSHQSVVVGVLAPRKWRVESSMSVPRCRSLKRSRSLANVSPSR